MGYETWPRKLISPFSIMLDSENPRLPQLGSDADQKTIRETLFDTGKIRSTLRSIAKNGFYPDQPVVIVREGTKFLVIEGNRRVCSTQLLLKPNLSPAAHERWVRKQAGDAKQHAPSITRIPAVIAPSREAVYRLMASKHIGDDPVRRWSRYAQGRFALQLLERGDSPADAAAAIGVTESVMKADIRELRLIETVLSLDWEDAQKQILYDSLEQFPIESLLRLLRSPATRERFGAITFAEDGWPLFPWDATSTAQFLKYLTIESIKELADGKKARLNTRTAANADTIAAYLEKIPTIFQPKKLKGARISGSEFAPPPYDNPASTSGGETGETPLPRRKPLPKPSTNPNPKRKTSTLPDDVIATIQNDKASKLLEELTSIIPEEHPHAAGMLLISLLEISLIHRIKAVKQWAECVKRYQTQPNKPPSLSQLMDHAKTNDKILTDENLRRALSDGMQPIRKLLNHVKHNDQHVITPTEVRDAATRLTPLFRHVLVNP